MGAITIEKELLAALASLGEKTELRDSDGNFLGLFTPKEQAEAELIEEARQIFDLEEANRRLATETEFYTTAEVLAHLKSLESAE